MSTNDSTEQLPSSSSERRLDEAIAEYLRACEHGEIPNRDEFVSRFPELAAPLKDFIAQYDRMEGAIASFRRPERFDRNVAREPQLGDQLRYFGDYELLDEIARGGMGIVFRARQVTLDRHVALKMILEGRLADRREVERFHAEAEASATLDHPHIVPIFEVGEHDGRHYFSMKLVEGDSLAERIQTGPLPPRDAARLLVTISRAVHYAHQRGILHRDLKPANILLDAAGQPHVTDFGLAKHLERDSGLTQTGAVLGTPSYMAPEQAAGRGKSLTTSTDVYGLGAILYAALTGRAPFQGENSADTLRRVQDEEPQSLRRVVPQVKRDLETICHKCLNKEVEMRYGSAEALADDLDRFLADEPIVARRTGLFERARKWARRRPGAATACVAGALAICASIAFLVSLAYSGRLEEANHELDGALKRETYLRSDLEESVNALGTSHERLTASFEQEQELRRDKENALIEVDQQREIAEKALSTSEDYLYFLRVTSADRAWWANDVARAEKLLAECPTDRRDIEWHFLNSLCHLERLTIESDATLKSFSVTPDGRFAAIVVTVAQRRLIAKGQSIVDHYLWLIQLGGKPEVAVFPANGSVATCAEFTPDGTGLLVGRDNGTVELINVADGSLNKTFSLTEQFDPYASTEGDWARYSVDAITVAPDGSSIAAALALHHTPSGSRPGRDHFSAVWRMSEPFPPALQIPKTFHRFSFSPDAKRVAAGIGVINRIDDRAFAGGYGTLAVWDVEAKREVFSHSLSAVLCMTYSQAGDLVTGHGDATIRTWDASGKEQTIMRGHDGPIWDMAAAPSGQLVTASADQTIRTWNLNRHQELQRYRGHHGDVRHVAVCENVATLVSASDDRTIKVWDAQPTGPSSVLEVNNQALIDVTFCADDKQIAFSSRGSTCYVADVEPLTLQRSFHGTGVDVAFCRQKGFLAISGDDSRLGVWKWEPFQQVHKLAAPASSRVSFSPCGRFVATSSADAINVWNVDSGEVVHAIDRGEFSGTVTDVEFSSNGNLLAFSVTGSGQLVPQIAVVDLRSHKILQVLRGAREQAFWEFDFNPDGNIIAAGSCHASGQLPGTVQLWDVDTGEMLHSLEGHRFGVWSVAFSPDGRRLATGAGVWTPGPNVGGEIKIWDVTYGQELVTLTGHTGAVMGMEFSQDGGLLASAGADWTVRIWNPRQVLPRSRTLKLGLREPLDAE